MQHQRNMRGNECKWKGDKRKWTQKMTSVDSRPRMPSHPQKAGQITLLVYRELTTWENDKSKKNDSVFWVIEKYTRFYITQHIYIIYIYTYIHIHIELYIILFRHRYFMAQLFTQTTGSSAPRGLNFNYAFVDEAGGRPNLSLRYPWASQWGAWLNMVNMVISCYFMWIHLWNGVSKPAFIWFIGFSGFSGI